MSDFKKQVRIKLIEKDMTMTDLANALGVSTSYVSDILNGNRASQNMIEKIKDLLTISDDEDDEE